MAEVQRHGFTWEKDILLQVYGVSEEIKYTSKHDLPASLNTRCGANVSIKVCGKKSLDGIDMADCLRIYDVLSSGEPYHMICVFYTQTEPTIKRLNRVYLVDLTGRKQELFGDISRDELMELRRRVCVVPKGRSPTKEERDYMYSYRDELHMKCGYLCLNIKCDSKVQRRLQCGLNRFQKMIQANPKMLLEMNDCAELYGKKFIETVESGRRKFKRPSEEPRS